MADIRCMLGEAADISRHEPAIVTSDRRILYHEMEERALFAQVCLQAAGCQSGARVALWMENDWRQVILIPAIIRARGVAVPISTRWPVALVREQLELLGCVATIADGARAQALREAGIRVLEPADLFSPAETMPAREIKIPHDRPAVIVFTSGSSGSPKAALLTYGNLYYSAAGANRNIHLASHDRWLLTLPLCHVGGLGVLFRCLLAGAAIALPDRGEPIEDAQARYRATHLSLVSTQLYRLLRAGPLPKAFAFVKTILLGGGPLGDALLVEAAQRGLPIIPSYGLTEMASQVTAVGAASPPDKRRTSGRVLAHRDVIISDDGEILVCGGTLFAGYVGPEGVDPARDASGWFHTGDMGSFDSDGYLTVTGRRDFMFISGGENVHPEEIEAALARLKEIDQALVVPVPDAEFGARPVAFLRTRGAFPKPDGLSVRLSEWLPRFKIPVAYHPWPADLDADLKPDRRKAAELAARLQEP